MAYTDNQVSDMFQKELGRAPTPFEVGKYSTASIQDFAGLKNTYSKYNIDQSVVDYLSYTGQDPSLKNRSTLAQVHGIQGYSSSYDQNVSLLKALKSGKTPSTTMGGSIVPPKTDSTPLSNPPGNSQTPDSPPTPDATFTGTIPGAVNQPPVNPDIATSKDAYVSSQKAVLDVTGRINSINTAIDSALQNKRNEIARSGGIVDESQLRSIVLAENQPLLAERKELLANRAQLVGEQTIAGKAYQEAVNAQKESDINFYKEGNLELGRKKADAQQSQFDTKTAIQQDQFDTKTTTQQTQFEEKLKQSGWKSTKVNVYDPGGNVVGQKVVWTQNPADKSIQASNKLQFTATSSGKGGIKNGVTNMGNTETVPKINLSDGATTDDVMKSLISGKPVYVKGSSTPLSQQDLYNLAILDMLGSTSTVGGRTPSGAITAVKDKETQIMNAYGLTPFDVATAKVQFKNISSANAQLLSTYAFTKTYGKTAVDNLDLALSQSDKVGRSGAKLANHFGQWIQGNFTPAGDLAEFETYIYTASREYAKVTSGGAKSAQGLTDTAQAEAEKLINAAQSPQAFKQVVQAMKNDMNNVLGNFEKETSSMPDAIKSLYGVASGAVLPRGGMNPKDYVEKSLTRQGLHYDTLIKDMGSKAPAGTQPALDNKTGKPVFATPEEIKNGEATPL